MATKREPTKVTKVFGSGVMKQVRANRTHFTCSECWLRKPLSQLSDYTLHLSGDPDEEGDEICRSCDMQEPPSRYTLYNSNPQLEGLTRLERDWLSLYY